MRYLLVFVLLTTSVSAQVIDGAFPVVSNLKAGVAKVDITPAEVKDVTVSSHTRVVNGVRDPLRAGVLVLDDGETKAAIVTLDVVGAWEDLVTRTRAAIEKETGVPAANIMVCASHNHSGPGWHENKQWASEVIAKLASTATADSYQVGGYEPNTSKLLPGAEQIILDHLGALADRVIGDVFESISKHPKDIQKREAEEKARLQSAPSAKP